MNLNVEISFEDCISQCLDSARATIVTYEEMEQKNISLEETIKIVRKSATEVEAIDSVEKLGLSSASAKTLLEMPITELTSSKKGYYENAVLHLEAILDNE